MQVGGCEEADKSPLFIHRMAALRACAAPRRHIEVPRSSPVPSHSLLPAAAADAAQRLCRPVDGLLMHSAATGAAADVSQATVWSGCEAGGEGHARHLCS